MNNKVKLGIKGYIKIYRNGKLIHEQPNTIQHGAYTILRRVVVGDTGFINEIQVFKTTFMLASSPITQITYSGTNKVTVIAIFDETSFNDTFDEMRLEGASAWDFSKVTGLAIAKDNLSQIAIEWTLEFIITGVTP
jgi:hypothetical protein